MRRLQLGALAFVLSLLGSTAARADDAGDRAKQFYKKAEIQFGMGKFDKALELYLKAYEAKPLAGFHFNIGQCYRNLGQYKKALFHYKQYLARTSNEKHRSDVETLISLTKEQQRKKEEREARRAQEEQAAATPPAPAPVQPAPVAAPAAPADRGERKGGLHQAFFWSGVGLSVALLAAGGVTQGLALGKSSTFKDPATPQSDLQDLKDSGEMLQTVSYVMFGLGAAAAAATIALYFFTDFGGADEPSEDTAISFAPLAGGGAVWMRGRF